MKKIIKIMAVTTVVGISMATYAFAGYGNQFFKNNVNYVDANGDGVCDNYRTMGKGINYVDTNGDGVCDNNVNNVCPKNGMGRKWGLVNK